MANAVITKVGNIVEVAKGDLNTPFSRIAQNVVTGFWVGQNDEKGTVDSNLQLVSKISYDVDTCESIDSTSITTITEMYDELKALL